MAAIDRGYSNLLIILHTRPTSIPFDALLSGIVHYLVHTPSTQPSPTPLTETIVQSRIWRTYTLKQYTDLGNAFGQALLSKAKQLEEQLRGLFSPSLSYSMQQWIDNILNGVKSGSALARLTIYRGILFGIESLEDARNLISNRMRHRIETSAVLAFAEIIDEDREVSNKEWLQEFRPKESAHEDIRHLAVILAAQYFTKLSSSVLLALNAQSVVQLLLLTISSAFMDGLFLNDSDTSMSKEASGKIKIEKHSRFSENLTRMRGSDEYANIPSICRLLAHVISAFSSDDSPSRRGVSWELLANVVEYLDKLATAIREKWVICPLSLVENDDSIDVDSREISTETWQCLKTLVFAIVTIQLSVLKTVLHLRPPTHTSKRSRKYGQEIDAPTLCIQIVHTLSRLSFVVMQLGGVSAMPSQSRNSTEYQFKELKQAFFIAMDVIAAHNIQAEALVVEVVSSCGPADGTTLQHANRAFALSCAEQLIPCLSDECIAEHVLPLCEPHMYDFSQRPTYESAHSVILSIFAAHAKKIGEQHVLGTADGSRDKRSLSLAERLVPGYVKCLLENVSDGRLTTTQFRLAYSALVRSAGVYSPASNFGTQSQTTKDHASPPSAALAKLCISCLVSESQSPSLGESERHRIHLALASLISDVSLELLPFLLHEVQQVVDNEHDAGKRKALLDVIYEEMMMKVGDREKDAVVQWWLERAKHWEVVKPDPIMGGHRDTESTSNTQ